MARSLILISTIIATAMEPALTTGAETDLMRYAITQGGLLLVVLVCFWYIRYLHQDQLAKKDALIEDKDEKLQAMMGLASEVKVALARSVDGNANQAEAIRTLTQVVSKIDERKNQR